MSKLHGSRARVGKLASATVGCRSGESVARRAGSIHIDLGHQGLRDVDVCLVPVLELQLGNLVFHKHETF